jgi:hypothetical protein
MTGYCIRKTILIETDFKLYNVCKTIYYLHIMCLLLS